TLSDPSSSAMPRLLPDRTLRASVVVPPMRLFELLVLKPGPVFPRAMVPVISVPMKLPCTVVPAAFPPQCLSRCFPKSDSAHLVWCRQLCCLMVCRQEPHRHYRFRRSEQPLFQRDWCR